MATVQVKVATDHDRMATDSLQMATHGHRMATDPAQLATDLYLRTPHAFKAAPKCIGSDGLGETCADKD